MAHTIRAPNVVAAFAAVMLARFRTNRIPVRANKRVNQEFGATLRFHRDGKAL